MINCDKVFKTNWHYNKKRPCKQEDEKVIIYPNEEKTQLTFDVTSLKPEDKAYLLEQLLTGKLSCTNYFQPKSDICSMDLFHK